MIKIYRDYKDKGVAFVSVDVEETEEKVKAYAAEFGVPWPIVIDGEKYSQPYTMGIPFTYLVDTKGIVREYVCGGLSERWFRVHLDRLLAQP
jgi:cytochrome oxidase Cu insertion factor (SCO1/SenC/PrrC family)